jgi:hypothetical protein
MQSIKCSITPNGEQLLHVSQLCLDDVRLDYCAYSRLEWLYQVLQYIGASILLMIVVLCLQY